MKTWSPRSISDLEAIAAYISRDSPAYADIVVQRIVASVVRLASFPQSGRIVPEFGRPDLREVIVRPYRVVYRVRQAAVEIATVVHAARLFRHLPEDPAVWERPAATEARSGNPTGQPVATSSPEVLSGTPVFTGTRVPVRTLIDHLEGGETIDDFLKGFPTVKREQIVAFLEEAAARMAAKRS